MMDRISVLAKGKEIPAQKERELNEHNPVISDIQGTSDLNQFEKLQTVIIRIHKSSGDTKEMVTTVKAPKDEKKSCNMKSSKFSLILTSKTQVQSKTKGGSHFDDIPLSYKELYEKLLEALVTEGPARLISKVFKGKSISMGVQKEEDLLRYEAQICHLKIENDKLSTKMETMHEDFQKIEESRMITNPGASHSNLKNNLINYSQYDERFKRIDEEIRNMKGVNASHKELEARELSLVPDLVIPYEFKMPDFEKYDGTSCLAPIRMDLQRVRMKANEGFKEYALRWRGVAVQVQPPMLEEEISHMFHDSIHAPFFGLILANPTKEFENLLINGELIENVINKGNSKVTSKSPTDQKVKADDVNECSIQSPRQYITPRPMKMPPNPSAHSYDQDSVCDFHLGYLGIPRAIVGYF
ncbi:hypothetical protein F3Y22_tig00002840pilonHSYRG01371 [Hibiscus syriacus]|uniref:Uncharacterized protein n=1 Tax=Hibiscus syriacus TaxID=106335 RepID=A0A6A3CQI4_HIBSY|nr:hypothetical protein F3Y22_tig00002840pilonHSYRG01371 [Hibiscus syriacus]